MVKLTRRGQHLVYALVTLSLLALIGFAGWIEGLPA
jgi:hypothetical protein